MKLKKIASLMLAGVMAVSMLTACGSKTETKPEGEGNNEGTTSSGYSAMLGEKAADTLKKKDLDKVFTFTDNADDQKALKKVIVNGVTQNDIEAVTPYISVSGAWSLKTAGIKDVDEDFAKEVKATSGVSGMTGTDSVNTKVYASVWVANGDIAMDTVIGEVFNDVKASIEGAKKEGTGEGSVAVDYTYTVSVSVENVPVKYDTTKSGSVNFVGVTVTRAAEIA